MGVGSGAQMLHREKRRRNKIHVPSSISKRRRRVAAVRWGSAGPDRRCRPNFDTTSFQHICSPMPKKNDFFKTLKELGVKHRAQTSKVRRNDGTRNMYVPPL